MKKALLPHYYKGHKFFFITFRLADSLPQSVIIELKEELQAKINNITENDEIKKREIIDELKLNYFKKFDHQLDSNPYGECVLKNRKIAQILYDKILSYHLEFYNLKCLCIMPNHVHLLLSSILNEEEPQLDKWLKLIKGGSAFLINKALNRTGKLWAIESFDRYIRNEEHYFNSFYYTINNPEAVGLRSTFSQKPFIFRCDIDVENDL